jgi:hypothetical protein
VTLTKESLKDAVGAENWSSEAQRQELERAVDKGNERLEALEDELFNPKNPGLDHSRLADRVQKVRRDIAQKLSALSAISSLGGIDLDKAMAARDALLADPKKFLADRMTLIWQRSCLCCCPKRSFTETRDSKPLNR